MNGAEETSEQQIQTHGVKVKSSDDSSIPRYSSVTPSYLKMQELVEFSTNICMKRTTSLEMLSFLGGNYQQST